MTSRLARSDERLPLYHRLRDNLARAIADRTWRIDEAIPTEAELARTHKLAVGTVRRAIDLLVEDGMLHRVQGRGTFVRRPTFSSSLARFFHAPDGMPIDARERSRILSIGPAELPADAAAGLGQSGCALHIRRLRLTADEPVLFEQIWLPLDPFERLLEVRPEDFPPLLYPLYESMLGVTVARASERLTIGQASADVQEFLALAATDPVAILERRAFDQGGAIVEWRRSTGDGKRFQYGIDVR